MRHIAWTGLALVLIASASAEEQPPIDAIVAGPAGEEGGFWNVTTEDLAAYPAVARAVAAPNHIITVGEDEQASTHAFFEQVLERDVLGIRVDGETYSVGITLAHALPPPDGQSGEEDVGKDSPGPAVLGSLAAVAAVGAALRRRG